MISQSHPTSDPASHLPTPRSTLSPGPISKSTPKRFKNLAPRSGPKDDPFRQAQLESSPLIALPDDVKDPFDAPRLQLRTGRRGIWSSRDRIEEKRNDEDLVYLLNQWQTFFTLDKPKRHTGHTETRTNPPDVIATAKGSPSTSAKWREKHHPHSAALSLPEKTDHESKSPQSPNVATESPVEMAHPATARLILKRQRLAVDNDFEDDLSGMSAPPRAKRIKVFSTPKRNALQELSVNKRSSTPNPATRSSPTSTTLEGLTKRQPLRGKTNFQIPHASAPRLGISATSSKDPLSSATISHDTICFKSVNVITTVQPNRKRGEQEANLSPSCERPKRIKAERFHTPNTMKTT